MRKIFLHIMVSLDGFIDGRDGEMDWHFVDDEFEEYINSMLHSIDGMIYGRKAFQLLAEYWPTAVENPAAAADQSNPQQHIEAAYLMNTLPKYVISSTLKETNWNNSHIINENIAKEIGKLKQKPGKDIALFAGAGLASSFMKMNLIDEYHLIINPVLLGGGTPLFQGGYDRLKMKLLEVKTFQSGAAILIYRPDGRE